MSSIILLAQIINVKSIVLRTQTPNASSIEIKSTRQKELDDVIDVTPPRRNPRRHPQHKHLDDDVDTSPPRRNAIICGCVATLGRKKQDFVANRKRKKVDDIVDVATQLPTYVAHKYKVVFK
jgi:hypothetical protein